MVAGSLGALEIAFCAQNLCPLAADSPKPKTDHTLGYVAQNAISSHVAQGMVCFWFGAVGGQWAQILGLLGAFWGQFADILWS